MSYRIVATLNPDPGDCWCVYFYRDGFWFLCILLSEFTRGADYVRLTYFHANLQEEAAKLLAVLTDELKERGLLPH